jgi:hypothetical protein
MTTLKNIILFPVFLVLLVILACKDAIQDRRNNDNGDGSTD